MFLVYWKCFIRRADTACHNVIYLIIVEESTASSFSVFVLCVCASCVTCKVLGTRSPPPGMARLLITTLCKYFWREKRIIFTSMWRLPILMTQLHLLLLERPFGNYGNMKVILSTSLPTLLCFLWSSILSYNCCSLKNFFNNDSENDTSVSVIEAFFLNDDEQYLEIKVGP